MSGSDILQSVTSVVDVMTMLVIVYNVGKLVNRIERNTEILKDHEQRIRDQEAKILHFKRGA